MFNNIVIAADNGFKSIRELQGIHLEKLDFFNLAEKERIKLLLISVREDNAKGIIIFVVCGLHACIYCMCCITPQ